MASAIANLESTDITTVGNNTVTSYQYKVSLNMSELNDCFNNKRLGNYTIFSSQLLEYPIIQVNSNVSHSDVAYCLDQQDAEYFLYYADTDTYLPDDAVAVPDPGVWTAYINKPVARNDQDYLSHLTKRENWIEYGVYSDKVCGVDNLIVRSDYALGNCYA